VLRTVEIKTARMMLVFGVIVALTISFLDIPQIFKDGKSAGYVDGNDEKVSSWMRFIRCARHKSEQNLFAFQYLGKVYYRTFKAILPGQEMLVWYDEKYPQYLGVPSSIFDMGSLTAQGKYLLISVGTFSYSKMHSIGYNVRLIFSR